MKKASAMFLFYFSAGLAITSTLVYHVTQKLTPANVNPALTLIVTYAVSLVLVFYYYLFFRL